MLPIFLAIFALFIGSGLFSLDEEGLIILSSFLWVDAAAGLFKKMLDTELVDKVEIVYSKFTWYIATRKAVIIDLIKIHSSRSLIAGLLKGLSNTFAVEITSVIILTYLKSLSTRRLYESRLWVVNFGEAVHKVKLLKDLENKLSVLSFSSTLLRQCSLRVVGKSTYSTLFRFTV